MISPFQVGPLTKYTQLRATVSYRNVGASNFTTLGSSALFALTDVATVDFLAQLYGVPRGR